VTSVIHPLKGHVNMKKIIIAGAVSALAAVSFAGSASAAPAGQACFGQIHKGVNAGEVVPGVDNVGQLLKALDVTGQGKKALVKDGICAE
jgi:uncharacterized membrane protein